MSEETNTEAQAEQAPESNEQRHEGRETFDAEYVAKLRQEAAKYRTEAKANAAAASRLAEIEEAQKTEEQKAADRMAAAEQRAAEAEARALRREVALESGLSREDAAFLDGITDEDAMRALAARLSRAATVPQQFHLDQSGRVTNPPPSEDAVARAFFGI